MCNLLQIRIYRPPDYSNILILGGLFVTILSLVYLKRRNLEFFYNKSAWATFTLVTSLLLYIILSLGIILLAWSPYVIGQTIIMVALCNWADHYIFILFLSSSFFFLFFSSPNLSGRRLDVYHTLAHGVALVRI